MKTVFSKCMFVRQLFRTLRPQLSNLDANNVSYKQDGATRHISRENIESLVEKFPRNVISRDGGRPGRVISPCFKLFLVELLEIAYDNKLKTVVRTFAY